MLKIKIKHADNEMNRRVSQKTTLCAYIVSSIAAISHKHCNSGISVLKC